MINKALAIVFLSALITSPGWALFETYRELAESAQITLEEAIRNALVSVPGTAVEAEIRKEDGRTVYEVEIIDSNKKSRKVFVDAQNGQTKINQ